VNNAKLKQVGKNFMLVAERIRSMSDLYDFLKAMEDARND
jgi:transcription-repair coupling factor (superfamily II helicase)